MSDNRRELGPDEIMRSELGDYIVWPDQKIEGVGHWRSGKPVKIITGLGSGHVYRLSSPSAPEKRCSCKPIVEFDHIHKVPNAACPKHGASALEPPATEAEKQKTFAEWRWLAFPGYMPLEDETMLELAWDAATANAALASAPDWRGLCEEMAQALKDIIDDDGWNGDDWTTRRVKARATLASFEKMTGKKP